MGKITEKDKILEEKKLLTVENLEEYHKKVLEDKDYGPEYKLIERIIKRYPKNNDPEIVALKICLIDTTNSTNLSKHKRSINIWNLAKHICSEPNLDNWIKKGNPLAINHIIGPYGIKKTKLFSFASKYCCYHNLFAYRRNHFAIYDTYVSLNLHLYDSSNKLMLKDVKKWRRNGTMNDYINFNNAVDCILKSINTEHKKRKFDHFIWYQVKEQIERKKEERKKHEMK